MKLETKVPLLIVTLVLVVGGFSVASALRDLRSTRESQLEETAQAVGAVVRGSLDYHMLEGRPLLVREAVARMRAYPAVDRVAIFSSEGQIAASSDEAQMGSASDDALVGQVLRSGKAASQVQSRAGHGGYDLISPIANGPSCAGCHDPGQQTLGAVLVGLDTTSFDARFQQRVMSWAEHAALMILLVGAVLTLSLRKLILGPLGRLEESAQRIAQGDYTVRAAANRGDEVGALARALNEMARQMGERAAELTGRNADLGIEVTRKTNELLALNAAVVAASQPLDLPEALNAILGEAMAASGMDAAAVYLPSQGASPCVLVQRGLPSDRLREIGLFEPGQRPAGSAALPADPTSQDGTVGEIAVALEATGGAEFRAQRAQACVPIATKDQELGTLCLFSREPRQLGPHELRWLSAMADAAAIAVKRAQSATMLREANDRLSVLLDRAVQGGFDVTYENPHLVKCWIEHRCGEVNCPAYESENLRCWLTAGTLCPDGVRGRNARNLIDCKECRVFQKSCGGDEITSIGESFNSMMFLLDREAKRRAATRRQLIERLMSVQEEERKRVARELHDQTSQSLTLLLVGLKTLEGASSLERVREQAGALEDQALQALDEVRRLALELRPTALDELGLAAALRGYLKETSARCGIPIDLRTRGLNGRLAPTVEIALYRIVQESVTNVIRHAEARRVTVTLEQEGGSIGARIRDDGRGFEVGAPRGPASRRAGLGLVGMEERAALLGGKLVVQSKLGAGTTVSVRIPLAPSDVDLTSSLLWVPPVDADIDVDLPLGDCVGAGDA